MKLISFLLLQSFFLSAFAQTTINGTDKTECMNTLIKETITENMNQMTENFQITYLKKRSDWTPYFGRWDFSISNSKGLFSGRIDPYFKKNRSENTITCGLTRYSCDEEMAFRIWQEDSGLVLLNLVTEEDSMLCMAPGSIN